MRRGARVWWCPVGHARCAAAAAMSPCPTWPFFACTTWQVTPLLNKMMEALLQEMPENPAECVSPSRVRIACALVLARS